MKCCMILRSLDRVFVFDFVKCLCIGATSKDPAQRFVDLGLGFSRNKRNKRTREFPSRKPQQRGESFHGQRLRARNWVFWYTPKEFWEEVERLADAANVNYHGGLGGGKNSQQKTQGGANRSNKKVNDARGLQQECGICLLLGSTNRAKSHSTENQRWSAHDDKIIRENVSNLP